MLHFNHSYGMIRAVLCLILTTSLCYAGPEHHKKGTNNNHGLSPDNHKGSMFFEKNYGQLKNTDGEIASNVQYYAATPKFTWDITDKGIRYVFTEQKETETEYFRLDLDYLGADFSRVVSGEEAAKVSYYEGQETAVSARAMYRNLLVQDFYPNIDLELKATKKGFKYNYIVKPGGNPDNIKMQYGEHNYAGVLKSGEFNITTALGEITESAPITYQGDIGK